MRAHSHSLSWHFIFSQVLLPGMGTRAPQEKIAVFMGDYQKNPAVLSSGFDIIISFIYCINNGHTRMVLMEIKF